VFFHSGKFLPQANANFKKENRLPSY